MAARVTFALLLATAIIAVAQNSLDIKAAPTPAISGKAMYDSYCASCHGVSGKGDGPVSPALKTAPPDLTTMAARNNGQFPAFRIKSIIQGDPTMPSHGSRAMPVWGPAFRAVSGGDQAQAQLRIDNLTEYLKSLQK